jgi:hypothetical protein
MTSLMILEKQIEKFNVKLLGADPLTTLVEAYNRLATVQKKPLYVRNDFGRWVKEGRA